MKVLLVIYAIFLSYPAFSLEYQVEENIDSTNKLDVIPAVSIDITLQEQLFEENYLFNNQFTLHHSEHFNLLVTTNVTQAVTLEKSSIIDNSFILPVYSPLNETNQQYGLIGRYSLTPEWKVSGGFIYSKPALIMGNEQSNTDNVALIGTSYSF